VPSSTTQPPAVDTAGGGQLVDPNLFASVPSGQPIHLTLNNHHHHYQGNKGNIVYGNVTSNNPTASGDTGGANSSEDHMTVLRDIQSKVGGLSQQVGEQTEHLWAMSTAKKPAPKSVRVNTTGMPTANLFGNSEQRPNGRSMGRSHGFTDNMSRVENHKCKENAEPNANPETQAKQEDDFHLVCEDNYIVGLFQDLAANPGSISPKRQYYLEGLSEDTKDGSYVHPVALFGETSNFVNAIMNGTPLDCGTKVLVSADRRCFISCTDNDKGFEFVRSGRVQQPRL
jgi:hypothetical protein